ncbi:MAG TPA: two-component regulator propeller domain-containing protein, partial [Verrucomicrobiae bacterium]|nr:two-component regulator propeller domain-containing protein [Verrucomicrobiae bacterium]
MPNKSWIFAVAGLLLCSFLPGNSAAAGAHYSVKTWTTGEGLPQNSVIAMTQTRDGYLWLGTLRGLARFDGVRFTVFDEDNTPGLNSSRIVRLFEDSKNNLWIGTEKSGVALAKDGRIVSVDLGRGSREGRVMSICEEPNGAVWLYTRDGQLARYVNGRVDVWPIGQSSFRSLIMEKSGLMWVGMDQGLAGLNATAAPNSPALPVEQTLQVRRQLDFLLASQHGGYWRLADGRIQKWAINQMQQDFGPYPWPNNVIVSAACEDEQGNLIVGTSGNPAGEGVFWFDAEGKAAQISLEQGLSSDEILSLTMDREGSLWVGTDGGGLNRVKRKAFDVLEASKGKTVQSVCQDGQGGLWIGYSGSTLHHWRDGAVQEFGPTNGLAYRFVEAVFLDQDRQFRVGTGGTSGASSGGLLELQADNFRPEPGFQVSREVWAIYQDRKGRLWVGTQNGLAYQTEDHVWKSLTTHDGLSANIIRAIADDADGNLWVGTEGGGLNCLRDGKITVFRKKDPLMSDDVSSLYADDDGVLWIGTTSSGLSRYYKGKWTRYTASKGGLISNHIDY